MVSYTDIDELVSITDNTLNRLSDYKNWGDALMLYFRYVQQRKQQENDLIYSPDSCMMKEATWSSEKFYKVKKILVELKLIETVKKLDEKNKILWHFIKVNLPLDITN